MRSGSYRPDNRSLRRSGFGSVHLMEMADCVKDIQSLANTLSDTESPLDIGI